MLITKERKNEKYNEKSLGNNNPCSIDFPMQ
jgi:hypothetical protein